MRHPRLRLLIFVTSILVVISSSTAYVVLAQSQNISAQAVAVKPVTNVKGMRADVWTANHPSNWYAIGSPVGICPTTPTCTGDYFETGFVKGTISPVQNVLQQYSTSRSNGTVVRAYGLGNLSNNTWYKFDVYYNSTLSKWEANRNYGLVYRAPNNLAFSSGQVAACGAEGGGPGVPVAVECSTMSYNVGIGWQPFDYTGTQTWGVGYYYCVFKPYTNGAIGWGPC